MAARLQAVGDRDALLRVSDHTGHGAGNLTDSIELAADMFAFIFAHLGVPFRS
jgi:prolyl oligopeptidase PreP (S9A serine peptidase family)